jgi:hypothetical protein
MPKSPLPRIWAGKPLYRGSPGAQAASAERRPRSEIKAKDAGKYSLKQEFTM